MMKYILIFSLFLCFFSEAIGQPKIANSITKGDSPSFYHFSDMKGNKERSLSEFKGKFILIDVWASWCTPCQREFPALDSLRDHYKDDNLIVLGVSIDNQWYRWVGAVNNFKLPEPQFQKGTNNQFEKEFGISLIPRMILLDPQGKVVDENMPKASDKKIYTIIDKALKTNI
ncbi:TlpA disulfide reductase family protein [Sphingobacterium sp. DR205]|uniref:TlpA family protein disulfide reductase n=1 Tax=Sphingobacterium sp. DR205 TaxID=2713573 RepID=UPI0013E4625A|nr:TlpA disulfide reductase family protein [Sphingobacterium sp. DR205]QIH35919.1 TlpA family protein disulfide reductase [Sphingobacterium sp. DR205]